MTFLGAFHLILRLYQQHRNFPILTNSSSCKPLVKRSSFWLSYSFLNHNFLSKILTKPMILNINVVWSRSHPWTCFYNSCTILSSYTVDLDTISRFSIFVPKLSPTSLIRIFKGNKSLTKFYNTTYSECRV